MTIENYFRGRYAIYLVSYLNYDWLQVLNDQHLLCKKISINYD